MNIVHRNSLTLVFLIALLCLLPEDSFSQFKSNVAKAYLLYNKARICEGKGKLDSAAFYIKESLLSNKNIITIRYYAWDVFLRSEHYKDAIDDINDYYSKNTAPDDADDILLFGCDSTTINRIKTSKDVQQFYASYNTLKNKPRRIAKAIDELREIITECHARDQIIRNAYDDILGADSLSKLTGSRLISYTDSINIDAMASYLKKNGFPNAVECDGLTASGKLSILLLHALQDSASYSTFPLWHCFDSTLRQAVYDGEFDLKEYLLIVDKKHMITTGTQNSFGTQLFGIWTNPVFDPKTKKTMRVCHPDIDDLEHVDDRRAQWLQPSLYEECTIIDTNKLLPKNYHVK